MKVLLTLCPLLLLFLFGCESQPKKVPIAILTPMSHPSLESMEKGFKEAIEIKHPNKYSFKTYNAHGNKALMHAEVEELARQDYSLIFTIGTSASQMTCELFAKKGVTKPLVFTCVNEPVEFRILEAEDIPSATVTGVKEILDLDEELNILLQLKPEIKTLLLVYNPLEAGLKKDRVKVEQILSKRGLSLIAVEVFQTREIKAKTTPFMSQSDAVLVLKDNTVVSGLDVLVKLCNEYHIPLMASDLDSPDRGAAFGYGVHEVQFGVEAAHKALQILEEKLTPLQIPITAVGEFSLHINKEAAEKQGIDPHILEGIKS